MAREKDPAEIIETIAQSIRVSQRGARRVRAHRFKELFGYQVLNSQRRQRIERLLAEAGIEVRPSLKDAGTRRLAGHVDASGNSRGGGQTRPGADSGVVRAHGLG